MMDGLDRILYEIRTRRMVEAKDKELDAYNRRTNVMEEWSNQAVGAIRDLAVAVQAIADKEAR